MQFYIVKAILSNLGQIKNATVVGRFLKITANPQRILIFRGFDNFNNFRRYLR